MGLSGGTIIINQGGGSVLTVRAATSESGIFASGFEDGDFIDQGLALATGDRILLWHQATASQNGIYVVQSSGPPVRATDADAGSDFPGMMVYVQEGIQNRYSLFVCTNLTNPTLGSDAISFEPLGAFQLYGTGNGGVYFGATDVTIYSPDANWVGSDEAGWIEVGDSSIYVGDNANDNYLTILPTGDGVVIRSAHTDADLSQEGLKVEVGDFGDQHIWFSGDNGKVQVYSTGNIIELVDSGDVWRHKTSGGVLRNLATMESRKGSSASATVTSGNTSVTVTHGAGYTPSAQDITVCPINNPTNDPGWWYVDTITSTQFTIRVRSDPGASGAIFAWRVDR